jgi:hypothetical protein
MMCIQLIDEGFIDVGVPASEVKKLFGDNIVMIGDVATIYCDPTLYPQVSPDDPEYERVTRCHRG